MSNSLLIGARRESAGDHVVSVRHECRIRIGEFAEAEPPVEPARVLVGLDDEQRQLALAEPSKAPVGHLANQPRTKPAAALARRDRDAAEVAAADPHVALSECRETAAVVDERPAVDAVDLRILAELFWRERKAGVGAAPGAKLLRVRKPARQLRKPRRIEAPEVHGGVRAGHLRANMDSVPRDLAESYALRCRRRKARGIRRRARPVPARGRGSRRAGT